MIDIEFDTQWKETGCFDNIPQKIYKLSKAKFSLSFGQFEVEDFLRKLNGLIVILFWRPYYDDHTSREIFFSCLGHRTAEWWNIFQDWQPWWIQGYFEQSALSWQIPHFCRLWCLYHGPRQSQCNLYGKFFLHFLIALQFYNPILFLSSFDVLGGMIFWFLFFFFFLQWNLMK